MRILFINQFYKPDTAATGQLLADIADSLVERGHDVHVICSRHRYDGSKDAPIPDENVEGVTIYRVFSTPFSRKTLLGRTVDYLSFYISAAWQALILPKPDVCVSLTTPPFISLIGLMLSKIKGTRNVIWVMDVYPEIAVAYNVIRKRSLLYLILSRISRILYRNAAAVITLGETMTEQLRSFGAQPGNLHTVHNWVPGETLGLNID
jgi:glycosyltransferase involved in cell wall biosynthesis